MVATLLAGQVMARADTRVALVIGNSTYLNVSALPNPINDANDISDSLRRLGFDVKTLTNARFDDTRRALINFGRQARGAEFAIIFFAGHGMEIAGENWLIPVDAQLATDLDVANETIGLQSLTRAVSNTTKLGLVILDACRSNPFLPKMQRTNLTRAVDRGLVRVEPNDNVLVAYSARDGTTANDGIGRNSPFTSSLLKNIETPGLDVRFLFAGVRDDVMAATKREQQPYIYGSLSKEQIYLKSSIDRPTLTDTPPQNARPIGPPNTESPSSQWLLGFEIARMTPELRDRYKIKDTVKGVVIVGVDSDSAASNELRIGDSIVEVESETVADPDDVNRLLAIKYATGLNGFRSSYLYVMNPEGELRSVNVRLDSLKRAGYTAPRSR